MLNVQNILPDTEFTIKINWIMPKLSVDLENEVERFWLAEQDRRGKEIFNGRIISASMVTEDGIDGYIVEYRHLIAQRARPALFCVVYDTDSHVLDIGIAIESPLSYDEILTIHRDTATKEYDKLKLVPLSEINQFIQDEASHLVGVSTALIQNFRKSTCLQEV